MELEGAADHSWVRLLDPDPETATHYPNKKMREVRAGHYVSVEPTPIPGPKLVIHSEQMAVALGLPEESVRSGAFLRFFSGDISAVPGMVSWATPYALAIMGTPMIDQCPFKTGDGYGDGRAISVGEVVINGNRWEMQLKGAGTTPFCRGADGRAVLRSSIREFLASEAMDALGVSTTRALCLTLSGNETVKRPWYSDKGVIVTEKVAITTRVAPSFLRVGHVDLFARRASQVGATELAKQQHKAIIEHLLFREYADVLPDAPLQERALALLDAAAGRIAGMVAGWIRVGFCQGNFNSDNCLAGGRTIDYGPFGWMDRYDPKFSKWIGSGNHFAFMNQPEAGYTNFKTLATAIEPLFDEDRRDEVEARAQQAKGLFLEAVYDVWRRKLGFASCESAQVAVKLWSRLEKLLLRGVDWTIAWRQLSAVLDNVAADGISEDCLSPLRLAFYDPPSASTLELWLQFVVEWTKEVSTHSQKAEGSSQALKSAAARMRLENPKYVPREWMLVAAYNAANEEVFAPVLELHELFKKPYDEQPEMEAKYFRKAKDDDLRKAGTAYMS